jgi:putative ABC transport system permease protein
VLRMAIIGGVIGMAVAIGVGRLAKSLLFEMTGYDPLVLTVATGALALVALGAGLLPAMRASKIDPMAALGYE